MRKWFIFMLILCLSTITTAQETPPITTANASTLAVNQILSVGRFSNADWSQDGEHIALRADTGVWIYDTDLSDDAVYIDNGRNTVTDTLFAPDGQTVLTYDFNGGIRLWDLAGNALENVFPAEELVYTADMGPSGNLITTGSSGILTRDVNSAATLAEAPYPYENRANAVAISPDEQQIAITACEQLSMGPGCLGTFTAIYNLADGTLITDSIANAIPENANINQMAFSPDGSVIAITGDAFSFNEETQEGTYSTFVILWNTLDETSITVDLLEEFPRDMAYLPDGRLLVATDNQVQIMDQSGVFTESIPTEMMAHGLALSPDQSQVVLAGAGVMIVDLATLETSIARGGHNGLVTSIAFTPDSARLVSASWDGTVRHWDLEANTQIAQLAAGEVSDIGDIALVDNGTTVILANWNTLERITIADDGSLSKETSTTNATTIYGLEVSVDNTLIVAGNGNGNISLYSTDLSTMTNQFIASSQGLVSDVAISSDNQRIAYVDREQLTVVDPTGIIQAIFPVQLTVQQTAFNPAGNLLASAGQELYLWDMNGGPAIHLSAPLDDAYSSVAFSPDGNLVVSGSGSGFMRVFDATTGELLFEDRQQKNIRDITFSPDGTAIAAGAEDGTILIWRVGSGN